MWWKSNSSSQTILRTPTFFVTFRSLDAGIKKNKALSLIVLRTETGFALTNSIKLTLIFRMHLWDIKKYVSSFSSFVFIQRHSNKLKRSWLLEFKKKFVAFCQKQAEKRARVIKCHCSLLTYAEVNFSINAFETVKQTGISRR